MPIKSRFAICFPLEVNAYINFVWLIGKGHKMAFPATILSVTYMAL